MGGQIIFDTEKNPKNSVDIILFYIFSKININSKLHSPKKVNTKIVI